MAADPLVPAQNKPYSMAAYLVVDVPPYGFTPAEVKAAVEALIGNLTASSSVNLIKFIGGES